jgi:hypothetical protein
VPVRVDDEVDARFILDTGIGLNLISRSFCARRGYATSGTASGKRMSGQQVSVPLARLRSLEVAGRREEDVPVGVFDMSALPAAFAGIDGFLSLTFFERRPFTLDPARGVLVLESDRSLAARLATGASVPVRIDRTPDTLGLFLEMDVAGGSPAVLEVDTGSDALILNTPYLERLGFDPAGPDVRTFRGTDETGHPYVRRVAKMRTPIFPPTAPAMRVADSPVIFQDVIYDGLVGHAYFRHFVVTYDLAHARMVLARP